MHGHHHVADPHLSRASLAEQLEEERTARRRAEASSNLFRSIFADSPVGIGLSDEDGHFVDANRALCALFGRPLSDLIGRSSRDFTHPDDLPGHAQAERLMAEADDGIVRVEKRYVRPDGSIRWAWLTVTMVPGPTGDPWTLAHVQDVTARKAGEVALVQSQRSVSAVADMLRRVQQGEDVRSLAVKAVAGLADAAGAALVEADGDDLVVTRAFGFDVVGIRVPVSYTCGTVTAWRTGERSFLADAAGSALVDPILLARSGASSVMWQPIRDEGSVVAVLVAAWVDRKVGIDGPAADAVEVVARETGAALHAQALREEVARLAETDPLTGLVNRRGWYHRLRELMADARQHGSALTVAVVDLDYFKAYNDEHGHAAGDDLLARFGAAALDEMRAGDLMARWGGEEFTVALPGCAGDDALPLLERLRVAVPDGRTCSIGHVSWDGVESTDQLVSRADAAMYAAKRAGRDRIKAG